MGLSGCRTCAVVVFSSLPTKQHLQGRKLKKIWDFSSKTLRSGTHVPFIKVRILFNDFSTPPGGGASHSPIVSFTNSHCKNVLPKEKLTTEEGAGKGISEWWERLTVSLNCYHELECWKNCWCLTTAKYIIGSCFLQVQVCHWFNLHIFL